MELKGKKAIFLGDSITEGAGTAGPEFFYWQVFGRKYGLGEVKGYGIGGTRIARQQHPSENARFDLDFCRRCEEMDKEADFVVVFGGTNDFGHGDAPLGTPADRTPDSFYGACHYLMHRLIELYPTACIVFMTPMHRAEETKEGKAPLGQYVKIIREVAENYSLPVLDLYGTLGVDPQIEVQRNLYTADGLHPNNAGAEKIADRLGHFLLSL